jgi:hypothetical protein
LRINDVVFSPHGWRVMIGSRDGLHMFNCTLCAGVKRLAAIGRARLGEIVRARP